MNPEITKITKINSRINLLDDDPTLEPKRVKTHNPEPWQTALSQAITNPKQLFDRLQLDSRYLDRACENAAQDFKVFVTESFLKRIKTGDINDPLLRQVLPLGQEVLNSPAYTLDPLEEAQARVAPGLLHKYYGRALLITNGHCAINCRFCFRRNYPYSDNHYSSQNHEAVYQYLSEHTEISELLLSGGDPLLLGTRYLQELIHNLESIPHLKRLRIHSRVPVVLPERINLKLVQMLQQSRFQIVMVIHCNHAREISSEVSEALQLLKTHCHSLLNQSVLLRGVNDSVETLLALQEKLFDEGVQSYYLHLLDKVKGTAHFDIPLEEAKAIYRELASCCPGYMLPKLVQEQAGHDYKTQITLDSLF